MQERAERARVSLEGLSVGDAFGEGFFVSDALILERVRERRAPPPPWGWTDDTEMAVSIVEELAQHGTIEQDSLAARFARRMSPSRGYGQGAARLLVRVRGGEPWRSAASALFGGMGSFGNGAAMRVAPLGAWFADDLDRLVDEARRSAEVTHAHAEGIAGAVAVAVAAALAWRSRGSALDPAALLGEAARLTPAGYVRDGLREAGAIGPVDPVAAALKLGNGSGVTAPDTVPFCLWVAAHHGEAYDDALWSTVCALGDRDTTCAIVGGVVISRTGLESIPAEWRPRTTARAVVAWKGPRSCVSRS